MRRAAVALIALTVVVAGCGGGSDDESGLRGALDAVSAGPDSKRYFAFSDIAAIADQTTLPKPGQAAPPAYRRWLVPASLGGPALTQSALLNPRGEPVDLFSADRFITVTGPDNGTRIDGLDGDTSSLKDAGDVFSDEDGTIVVATSAAARDEILGQGDDTLGEDGAYAAAADCLGDDAVAAAILPARDVGASEGDLVAVGVRGGDSPTDVLCLVGDADTVKRADAALRKNVDRDADFSTASTHDHDWARAVAKPESADAPLGYFYQAVLQQLRLKDWLSD